jgi:hypothetical protein
MKKSKLPKTDSIQELAAFWDTHDLTDFEDELEEVAEPVLRSACLWNRAKSRRLRKWLRRKGFPRGSWFVPGCSRSSRGRTIPAGPGGAPDHGAPPMELEALK